MTWADHTASPGKCEGVVSHNRRQPAALGPPRPRFGAACLATAGRCTPARTPRRWHPRCVPARAAEGSRHAGWEKGSTPGGLRRDGHAPQLATRADSRVYPRGTRGRPPPPLSVAIVVTGVPTLGRADPEFVTWPAGVARGARCRLPTSLPSGCPARDRSRSFTAYICVGHARAYWYLQGKGAGHAVGHAGACCGPLLCRMPLVAQIYIGGGLSGVDFVTAGRGLGSSSCRAPDLVLAARFLLRSGCGA